MPTKFKPDSFEHSGSWGARTSVLKRSYIKATSKKELFDYINDPSSKPKIKQKCINELVRRGIKLQWIEIDSGKSMEDIVGKLWINY